MTLRCLIAIKKRNPEYHLAISVSLALQLFFILYGFTGNFLYDTSFLFYAVAVAVAFSIRVNLKKILASNDTKNNPEAAGVTLQEVNYV